MKAVIFIFLFASPFAFSQKNIIKNIEVLDNSNNFQNEQEKNILVPIANELTLKYNQNSIIIHLQSQPAQAVEYQLLSQNFHTKKLLTQEPKILFTNLPSGEYDLKISDSKGVDTLKIKVESPLWFRWWFLPMMFLYAVVLLGVLGYFFSLYRLKQRLKIQSIRHEMEIKALRAQMNPHFIFNSMNTIDAYILRKRFVEASDCLQKFSKLIRLILENSENQTISITQELSTLQLYVELEQERFSNSFSFKIEAEPALKNENYQIPPLLIQPFVENAILHGVRNLTDRKGEIIVHLKSENTKKGLLLNCQISDNGIGRKAAAEINLQRNTDHKSMGTTITMERIATYQALYGDKMETNFIDLQQGTNVEIKLPLVLEK